MDMTGKMSEIDMQGGSGHEDARSQRKATGTRCSAWVRRLAASLFVFAALGTALPAAAQTDVWTATITPTNLGGFLRLRQRYSQTPTAAPPPILSDDDFTHGSTDLLRQPGLVRSQRHKSRSNSPPTSRARPTPPSPSSSAAAIPSPSPTASTISGVRVWSGTGLTWTSGTAVNVKITATNSAPTVANPIPDQAATVGTAFSYQFPLNTFHDADTGSTLTYTATKADGNDLPTWLGFTASTRTFAGTAQAADVETLAVKVTASDGTASVSDEFNIGVRAASMGTAHCTRGPNELWCATAVSERWVRYYSAPRFTGRCPIRTSSYESVTYKSYILAHEFPRTI